MELDQRHDELLRELDELDKQIEAVLAIWLAEREARLEGRVGDQFPAFLLAEIRRLWRFSPAGPLLPRKGRV